MVRNIMVPLDMSPLSEHAAHRAGAIAGLTGAAVQLVHVYQPPVPPFAGGYVLDTDFLALDREKCERQVHHIADQLRAHWGCECSVAMLAGEPADALKKHALCAGADLVVMSTHGRTGVKRAWFGSVADALARRSSVPVLMVRRAERQTPVIAADSKRVFRRVLIALDGSTDAERVLACLSEIRAADHADRLLVRVVNPVPLPVVDYLDAALATSISQDAEATDELVSGAHEYLTETARRLEHAGAPPVRVKVAIAPGAGAAIADTARRWRADLVAITSHGRGASRLVMGSVADKVLRGTACSVLLMRKLRATRGADRLRGVVTASAWSARG